MLNPTGWSSPQGQRCHGAGPLHQPLPTPALCPGLDRGAEAGGMQAGRGEGGQAVWLLGSLCLPGGSQRVSSTRKTPSKVTLGTKSPPSHRSGGFVPLHRPAGAPSSPSAQALAVFFIPGSYFANHFIMGGEKFDSTHPEGYLFGENSDLNFLGNRPVVVGTGGGAGLGGLRSTGAPLPKPVVAVCHGLCGCRLSPSTGRACRARLERAQ